MRGHGFSETKWQWKLDLDDSNFVTGIAAGKGTYAHTTCVHITLNIDSDIDLCVCV